jgi:MFS family permease
VIGLLGLASAWATGRACDRHGQRAPMLATLATGSAGLALTLPGGTPLWLFAAGYGLFLAAYWGYLPPASAEVAARSGEHDRQPALMAFYAAMWTGAAVAPALGAVLHSWTQAATVALGAWVLAALVSAATFTTARVAIPLVPRSLGAP